MVLHCYRSPCPHPEAAWPGNLCSRTFPNRRRDRRRHRRALCAPRSPVRQQDLGPGGAAEGREVLGGPPAPAVSPTACSLCRVFGFPRGVPSQAEKSPRCRTCSSVTARYVALMLGEYWGGTGGSAPQNTPPSPCTAPRIVPVWINPKFICQEGTGRVRPCSWPL